MMSCGPISYLAIGAVVLLAFVLVAAICAVALAHRERLRASKRDPYLDPRHVEPVFPQLRPRPDLGDGVVEAIDPVDRYRRAQN